MKVKLTHVARWIRGDHLGGKEIAENRGRNREVARDLRLTREIG